MVSKIPKNPDLKTLKLKAELTTIKVEAVPLVEKVIKTSIPRPKSAANMIDKIKCKLVEKKSEPEVETKKFINVPFAENRMKG